MYSDLSGCYKERGDCKQDDGCLSTDPPLTTFGDAGKFGDIPVRSRRKPNKRIELHIYNFDIFGDYYNELNICFLMSIHQARKSINWAILVAKAVAGAIVDTKV